MLASKIADIKQKMKIVMTGKRLLILGGSIQCLKVVIEAKKLGIYTIVTDINATKEVRETADEVLDYSVLDTSILYEWCKDHPVDGVLNYCIDYAQHTHQTLCELLGLPCYGTAEQYHYLTDKEAFKQLCKRNNVGIIPEYTEEHPELINYPVLVKPAESSGSRGISICNTYAELTEAISTAKDASRNGKIIIEKYMGGKQDFTVTYLVIDGTPHLIRIGDRYLGKAEDGLDRQCICTVSPSSYHQVYCNSAQENIVKMIKSIGIQNGPVFFQGFIDDGKIRLYDPGIRFPGGEYDTLFFRATGINVVQAMIGFALTGEIVHNKTEFEDAYLLNSKLAVQLTVTARAGIISEYSGFEDISRIPEVVYVAKKSQAGASILATGDVKQRVVEVDYLTDDYLSAKQLANKIYATLIIRDQEGKDMIVSKAFQ